MALDAQSNWNAEMARSIKVAAATLPQIPRTPPPSQAPPVTNSTGREVQLPVEIIQQILSYIPHRASSQRILWACCLVSRTWYSATVPLLYTRPYLRGGNFQEFVATVCPSKNAHVRLSQLAGFVRVLDMGELVHDGSKSLTARLLGRLKGNLVEFIAPQASFSINSFAALSKCAHLSLLNLSLMSASVPMKLLFQTLQSLTELKTLYFPRTYVRHEIAAEPYQWPPILEAVHFGGGIDDVFLHTHMQDVPQTLQRLSIQSCSRLQARRSPRSDLEESALQGTLVTVGPQLRHLTIRHPLVNIDWSVLDQILIWCPNLIALRISADLISNLFFSAIWSGIKHPLRILDIDVSESPNDPDVMHLSLGTLCETLELGALPDLRCVRVSERLEWQKGPSRYLDFALEEARSLSDLVDLLEEQDKSNPLGIMTGVWTY